MAANLFLDLPDRPRQVFAAVEPIFSAFFPGGYRAVLQPGMACEPQLLQTHFAQRCAEALRRAQSGR